MDRNKLKANAVDALAETLLAAATLAIGLTVFHLLANTTQAFAVASAITTAFGANSFLTPSFTAVFGPTIDRLRGLEMKGADQ